ncbi:MAG: carbon-nitrogen hydrolase family protein [Sneathiella sp.]|nr:carbon-nitrogen hydrolase family protein [Sneathiella sp.]
MIVAGAQFQPVAGDICANLEKIKAFTSEAKAAGAAVLIFPELAVQGYGAADQMGEHHINGKPVMDELQKLAKDNDIALIVGIAEQVGEHLFNSAVFVRPDEGPVFYRKSHLYGPYEKGLFKAVDPMTVIVPYQGLKIGMLICYDVEFPENVRRLAKSGADLIAVPTATPKGSSGAFIADKMLPTRAFENQLFIAYINFCGSDGVFFYQGGAGVHAPDGMTLASTGNGEGLIFAEIKPSNYEKSRAENTYLQDLKTVP